MKMLRRCGGAPAPWPGPWDVCSTTLTRSAPSLSLTSLPSDTRRGRRSRSAESDLAEVRRHHAGLVPRRDDLARVDDRLLHVRPPDPGRPSRRRRRGCRGSGRLRAVGPGGRERVAAAAAGGREDRRAGRRPRRRRRSAAPSPTRRSRPARRRGPPRASSRARGRRARCRRARTSPVRVGVITMRRLDAGHEHPASAPSPGSRTSGSRRPTRISNLTFRSTGRTSSPDLSSSSSGYSKRQANCCAKTLIVDRVRAGVAVLREHDGADHADRDDEDRRDDRPDDLEPGVPVDRAARPTRPRAATGTSSTE